MTGIAKLRMRTKLGFGVGATAEGAIQLAFNTWNFLFYNQVLGLSGTLSGLAVTISLVLDGISEPLVGSISDRWRSKLGRRHPFLYASAVPLGISFYLLYVPPSGLSGIPLFLWFTLFATLHRQALTLYQIPHLALGPELTKDYHERSVVMSYTTLFGVLSGAATYFYGWTWFSHQAGGTTSKHAYSGMALGVGLVSTLAILASAHFTRDQIPRLTQPTGPIVRYRLADLLAEINGCLKNPNYRNTLLGLLFVSATIGVRETVQSYTSLFYWELDPKKIRVFGLVTPPAFIIAFALTARLHRLYDKRNTCVASLGVLAFATAAPVSLRMLGLFPANGSTQLTSVLMLFTFLFYGALAVQFITILSMLGDIADEHELQTGKRQEGVFVAARTFFSKLSSGLGHILAGAAVDIIQFPSGAKPGQVAHEVLFKLGVLDGQLAAIPAVIAMVFYARYKIDKTRFAEIQSELAKRRTGPAPVGRSLEENAAAAAVEPQPI